MSLESSYLQKPHSSTETAIPETTVPGWWSQIRNGTQSLVNTTVRYLPVIAVTTAIVAIPIMQMAIAPISDPSEPLTTESSVAIQSDSQITYMETIGDLAVSVFSGLQMVGIIGVVAHVQREINPNPLEEQFSSESFSKKHSQIFQDSKENESSEPVSLKEQILPKARPALTSIYALSRTPPTCLSPAIIPPRNDHTCSRYLPDSTFSTPSTPVAKKPENFLHRLFDLATNGFEMESARVTEIRKLGLNPFPPLPSIHPILWEKARDWIEAHPDAESQQVAEAFLYTTTHVSQAQFEKALETSVLRFNDWIEQQESKKYILYTGKANKSNKWVAQLGLKHLTTLPTQVVEEKHRIKETTLKNKIHKIVIFDDAIYSGTQISETLMTILEPDFSISVIAPFVSDPRKVLSPPPGEGEVHLFWTEKMLALNELMDPSTLKRFADIYYERNIPRAGNKYPIYFDFKIPDFVSSYPKIYEDGMIPSVTTDESGTKQYKDSWHKWSGYDNSKRETCFIEEIKPPYKS